MAVLGSICKFCILFSLTSEIKDFDPKKLQHNHVKKSRETLQFMANAKIHSFENSVILV